MGSECGERLHFHQSVGCVEGVGARHGETADFACELSAFIECELGVAA